MVLTHHPLRPWLADGQQADEWLRNGAHLHLFGHVHEQEIAETRHGTGSRFVRITAGAAHGDDWPKGAPAHHGYNVAAIVRDAAGQLRVRMWPRSWSEKAKKFRVDADALDDGAVSTTLDLGVTLAGGAPAAVDPPRVPPADPTAVALLSTTPATAIPGTAKPVAPGPVEVVIFHSPKDDDMREELETHLALLRRGKVISSFSARSIELGADKAQEVAAHVASARVFLVLISPSFLASDFYDGPEFTQAVARGDRGEAIVVSIYLKTCDWATTSLHRLQGLPRDGVPVAKRDHDEAFTEVARELRHLVEKLPKGA
jgi:hypothetical protein